MSRTILYIPRMYSDLELKKKLNIIPEDFVKNNEEFWNYVENKISQLSKKIKRIYRDCICNIDENILSYISSIDIKNYYLIKKLIENGAILEVTEDLLLVNESQSWNEMLTVSFNPAVFELYMESQEERNNFIAKKIDASLLDGELGILFMEPSMKITLGDDIKIIRVCPFDPLDYLKSWQVKLDINR